METLPLEMDDIFDENDDDDIVPTRLPDLDDLDLDGNLEPMRDSRDDENNEQTEGGEEPLTDNPELLAKLKSLKGASKNVQRRTYLKLDADRLTGERGIPVLPKVFKNVKLKGKRHEAEDLKTILHHLEHWGHRMYPKMPFTEVLERIERLGSKKAVQTCVKRIRLGMPILASEFEEGEQDVRREGDEGSDEQNEENTTAPNASISNQIPNDDEIDEFLSTAAEMEHEQTSKRSQNWYQNENLPQSSQNQKNSMEKASLSEETRARIERSKKLAMERRAARLAKTNHEQANNPVPSNPHLPTMPEPDASSLKETETTRNDDIMEISGADNGIESSMKVNNKESDLAESEADNGIESSLKVNNNESDMAEGEADNDKESSMRVNNNENDMAESEADNGIESNMKVNNNESDMAESEADNGIESSMRE